MPIRLLPSLLLLILVWGFTPGPANIYAMGSAIVNGRKAALRMWWGLLIGFLTAAATAAVVTHFLGTAFSSYVVYIKYLGAAYLMWLALNIFRSRKEKGGTQMACSPLSGFIVQLTNAKMILFDFMAYGMFVLPYSNRLSDLLIVAALLLIAGPGANLVWLLLGSWLQRFFENYQRQVNVAMAIALAVCSLVIVFTK